MIGTFAGPLSVRPRRARCLGCGRTHVLLASGLLSRRRYAAVVFFAALALRAAGLKVAAVAARLQLPSPGRPGQSWSVPASTARSWLARFAARAGWLRQLFTGVLPLADPRARPVTAAGSPAGDALAALEAVTEGLRARFGLDRLAAREAAVHLTAGMLLAPSIPGRGGQHQPARAGRRLVFLAAGPGRQGRHEALLMAIWTEEGVTQADRDVATRRQRAQTIALWRWSLIEPAMDPALSARQRGAIVRGIAAREHAGPFGAVVSVSRKTVDRWITARRAGGFGALVPAPRQCAPRTGAQVVELAVGLRKENPARTAAQVRRVLIAQLGWALSERAIQRWFEARELTTRPGGQPPQAYGRFEAQKVNEIWTADLMDGPKIGGRATWLAGIIDDRAGRRRRAAAPVQHDRRRQRRRQPAARRQPQRGRQPGRARRRRRPGRRCAVSAPAMPASQLAVILQDTAEGICADAAATGLIAAHGRFLHEPTFRRIIAAGSAISSGEPVAVIRWKAGRRLACGRLSRTGRSPGWMR